MGGRKSYSMREFIGDLSKRKTEKNSLDSAIINGNARDIARSTFNIVVKSKTAIDSLASAIDMLGIFNQKNISDIKSNDIKKYTINYWNTTKEKNKLKVKPEFEKLLIDSAVNTIRGRGKK